MLDTRTADLQERNLAASEGVAKKPNVLLRTALGIGALASVAVLGERVHEYSKPDEPNAKDLIVISELVALHKELNPQCTGALSGERAKAVNAMCSGAKDGGLCKDRATRLAKMDRFADWVDQERDPKMAALGIDSELTWHKCDPSVPNPVRGNFTWADSDAVFAGLVSPRSTIEEVSGDRVVITSNSTIHDPWGKGTYTFELYLGGDKNDLVAKSTAE